MSDRNRIDVHQHVVPPFWADALPAHGGDPSGWGSPTWSPESAIAFMDSLEIQTGVLSLTAPGVQGWNGQAKRDMAHQVNEYVAGLVAQWPTRFGNFATLPLPDVDGTLAEIGHAFDTLQADGVVLLSNYGGTYLGDPAFESVWAELDHRRAVVFIHPAKPAIDAVPGMPGPLLDYPFDTTRTTVQLVLNGVIARHPNVRIILSHAGGFLPYTAYRFAELAPGVRNDVPNRDGLLDLLRTFYFDTALSAPSALPSLTAFAQPDRMLYGSDFPYAPPAVSTSFTHAQDAYAALGADRHAAINHANALPLFPRLAALAR
ncbi:2-hydroxy-1-naphthoic acid nonoxidative decarboxylase [Burkholderia cenocepacia]|uniref:2-hydroxy-1-naphthoic acid nonoxidative decarboxylase n=1 Tax=Burkholderia cenocepacia TaxID=95486 RepID=UPI0019057452|nr:2-hydroxy-1-naphthoic acid nonoxidative decarboxylase [Burkholderia cenocepacia]MBJ9693771.1 2-hydroxy-1-naphthoic acid nonoxidative decarboxylase [Burkholderia cenocepacia]MBN3530880.1 2-hydroxy-1-naphthoic acid nonoxidative decarboxylase [Burkholderia cenocepacia]MBO1855472.1 2-hydroxy-1-naphthoic acid nonoxidative decarboxylase [Burkholderia cenocepacia]MBR8025086.1 2-hydroxy-1-naphthoic acid nonoxidative decarboxylase [Burkholderia cenocepacia]MBR8171703.1 2-hydroxy-1-naphthoic acid non